MNALAKAMKFIYSDFEGALSVAKKEFPDVDEKLLRNALKRIIDEGTVPKSTLLCRESWEKAVGLRKEVGDIKGTATYEDNVDMTFSKKIK